MSNINNLFNNPMVESAKKSMTPEQIEEYKRIGNYMYNSVDYKNTVDSIDIKESNEEDLLIYAMEALKAGGDPKDLTEQELQVLNRIYGERWYEMFGLEEHEVPKVRSNIVSVADIFEDAKKKADKLNLSRQQRRLLERQMAKDKEKVNKK